MTPLITEMVQLSPNPEQATWFDLGHMAHTDGRRVQADAIMRLPFDKTAIVGIDKDGAKFALWLVGGDGSVADGVAARVDRLTAIGNGQVPQCAAAAWRMLGGC